MHDNAFHEAILAILRGINRINHKVDSISETVHVLSILEQKMSELVDSLVAEVTRNRSVTDSAVLLLELLVKRIGEAADAGDIEKIKSVVAEVRADSDVLASAIVRSTPADPNVPPAPPPA